MSFSVEFLGCKISQTDMQGVRERLLAGGHGGGARGRGGARREHLLRHARGGRQEPQGRARRAPPGAGQVYVTGCATRLGADGARGPRTHGVTVVRETAEEAAERIARELGATACVGPEPRLERTRAFVKVQDGCTFGCAFCVIPKVRGDEPLAAAARRARRGAPAYRRRGTASSS